MAKKAAARQGAKRPAGRTTAREAIRQLDAAMMGAAKARDAAALVAAFYAPDAVLMPPNHPEVKGKKAIQAFFQGLMDQGVTAVKLETRVTADAGDLAYGRGRYTLTIEPAGGAPMRDVGKFVVVYRRQPDRQWRAVADIFNSDSAPGAGAQ